MEPLPGMPYPQGAHWDGAGTNFAVYSEAADSVEVCLVDDDGNEERVPLEERTAFVWHAWLAGVGPGRRYGFRADGPFAPDRGFRFDARNLLLDPYARAVDRGVAVVVDPAFDWGNSQLPATPTAETIVYETHVKGISARHPDVPPELRGTYAGLAHPAVIEHLRSLGVTAVELLPVHQIVHRPFLRERGLRNYWGYDSIGFFAPHDAYSSSGSRGEQVREFKAMVRALHDAGLEVFLDVVYNHTGEGGPDDPTICFRGIDNRTYYLHHEDADGRLAPVDFTGTGNTTNFGHPQVLQLIMDSLRYWAGEMRVDGFRFDLTSAIGRELVERNTVDLDTADWVASYFDRRSSFFEAVAQDPVLARVKMIAEPWDITGEGYQVGNYPARWSEWNGRYRDTLRDYWRSAEGTLPDLATRLAGSSDLFADDGRYPPASINFVTAHDGFTLADLVSYNDKHNEANGEGNRDGASDNRSWNSGVEGPTDDPGVRALRVRRQRTFIATLAFSQGVPMLLGGDEIGRTQNGNNNAYCQDNELSWYDWELDDERRELLEFTRSVLALRRAHPVLRRRRWLLGSETMGSGAPDVVWLTPDGHDETSADWARPDARALALFLNGGEIAGRDADGSRVADSSFLLLLNAWWESLPFLAPGPPLAERWTVALDTAASSSGTFEAGERVTVEGRSLVLLESAIV
jgi:isoamylase